MSVRLFEAHDSAAVLTINEADDFIPEQCELKKGLPLEPRNASTDSESVLSGNTQLVKPAQLALGSSHLILQGQNAHVSSRQVAAAQSLEVCLDVKLTDTSPASSVALLSSLVAASLSPRTESACKRESELKTEARLLEWMALFFTLPDLKHIHFHGSVDFSGGRLDPAEIQVFRTATFLAMGPSPARISSAAIPVFYFPATLDSSYSAPLSTHWSLIGLPSHSPSLPKIRKIPTTGIPGSDGPMDVSVLTAYLSEDVAVGRRPVVVVVRCGFGLVSGEWDDLGSVRALCSRFGCWMHVECDNMSLMEESSPIQDAQTMAKLENLRCADSIAFHASSALKLVHPQDLPSITLFNTVDPRLMDPVHVIEPDEGRTYDSTSSLHRRSSAFSSAGGALIRDRLSVDLNAASMLARTESFSSNMVGGVQTLGTGLSSAKLLKRMSSSSLFQAACFSVVSNGIRVTPTPLQFTLPWLLWSLSGIPELLRGTLEVAKELTEKLSDALLTIPELDVLQPPAESNYLTLLYRFNPTVASSQTLLTHPLPPVHVSHVPSNSAKPAPLSMGPWTPGFGTPEALLQMDATRKEAWGNRMNSDLGTKFVECISKAGEIKDGLQLKLVKFAGYWHVQFQACSYVAENNRTQASLIESLIHESAAYANAINATLRHQTTIRNLISEAQASSNSSYELRYIPPSSVAAWKPSASEGAFIALGGLHFTPSYLNLETDHIDPQVVRDLDALNLCLAEALELDPLLGNVCSKGAINKSYVEESQSVGGLAMIQTCIRIGMDKSGFTESRISNLISVVLQKGRELECGDQFLATLSEVIKRGIQTAQENLKMEHQQSDQVSIFSSLPVIGTVLGIFGMTGGDSHASTMHHNQSSIESLVNGDSSETGIKKPAVARTFTLSSGFSTVNLETVPTPNVTRGSISASNIADTEVVGIFDELELAGSENEAINDGKLQTEEKPFEDVHAPINQVLEAEEYVDDGSGKCLAGIDGDMMSVSDLENDADIEDCDVDENDAN
ncbi:hypothetical protein CcCBS67573_g02819 [Chytriomyces confervae]|uniref:Uncharacterized protein n=1 Tax=Chytriomyces confervae TaxID=246404 RepID=A0A507FKF6_9FUNG|nr:hypothetical protein CcCBS67573_g02819 [Chytriomyces confervae]